LVFSEVRSSLIPESAIQSVETTSGTINLQNPWARDHLQDILLIDFKEYFSYWDEDRIK
jgi:hypothetical protein